MQNQSTDIKNNTPSSLLQKFISWIKRWVPYSFGIKMIGGALIGLLSGTKVFNLLIEYSIFNYCLKYGVRVPIEGVGLLGPTANIISFGVSFLIGIGFIFLILILKYAFYFFSFTIITIIDLKALINKDFEKIKTFHQQITTSKTVILTKNILLVLTVFMVVIGAINLYYPGYVNLSPFHNPGTNTYSFGLHVLLLLFLASQSSIARNKPFTSFFALFIAASLLFTILFFLPTKQNFNYFLKATKYGGGIPIILERDCRQNKTCEEYKSGYLFLITEKRYIVFDNSAKEIFEIPSEQVMKISYPLKFNCILPQMSK